MEVVVGEMMCFWVTFHEELLCERVSKSKSFFNSRRESENKEEMGKILNVRIGHGCTSRRNTRTKTKGHTKRKKTRGNEEIEGKGKERVKQEGIIPE